MKEETKTIVISLDRYNQLLKIETDYEKLKSSEKEIEFERKVLKRVHSIFEKLTTRDVSIFMSEDLKNYFYGGDILACGKEESIAWIERRIKEFSTPEK